MNKKIPIWIYVLQGLLTLILLTQSITYYQLQYPGIDIGGIADKRSIYELAGRTMTMALISIIVMLSRNPGYFVVLFLVNIFREGQETFIDPLFPPANASMPPIADFIVHIIILSLEILALTKLYKLSKIKD